MRTTNFYKKTFANTLDTVKGSAETEVLRSR